MKGASAELNDSNGVFRFSLSAFFSITSDVDTSSVNSPLTSLVPFHKKPRALRLEGGRRHNLAVLVVLLVQYVFYLHSVTPITLT